MKTAHNCVIREGGFNNNYNRGMKKEDFSMKGEETQYNVLDCLKKGTSKTGFCNSRVSSSSILLVAVIFVALRFADMTLRATLTSAKVVALLVRVAACAKNCSTKTVH